MAHIGQATHYHPPRTQQGSCSRKIPIVHSIKTAQIEK